jgi:hypothetical protein
MGITITTTITTTTTIIIIIPFLKNNKQEQEEQQKGKDEGQRDGEMIKSPLCACVRERDGREKERKGEI